MSIAYKLFHVSRLHKGQLFPLYVNANKPTPIGEWVEAECGEMINGKVKSKLGHLAYRPAWHLSDLPIATHIGMKDENGKIAFMKPDSVWCECEYSDSINYQEEANSRGVINDRFDPKKAYLDYIPKGGYYRYKTNPQMMGDWILAGEIKVNRLLNDMEVENILRVKGITPMPRYGGAIELSAFGF